MTLQVENHRLRRTAERTPRQPSDPVSFWLIAAKRTSRKVVLTVRTDDEQETLLLFSSEEEAELFLRFGGVAGGWRARESGAGELVSVLSGPCAGVKSVALDPSPEMVVEGTVGLVSLPRGTFMNLILARRGEPPRLGEPRERRIMDHYLKGTVRSKEQNEPPDYGCS